MSEANPTTAAAEQPAIESPPPAAAPVAQDPNVDPRRALHRLASELMRAHNRKLLVEFLQLRRALR
jgi:hypothetical protein